jgi:hypothetical protein
MPLQFLMDQKDFIENRALTAYNPTLPIYL